MGFLKKYRFDLIILIILIIFPIVIWGTMKPLNLRFGSLWMVLTSLGQLTALVGTVLTAVSMMMQVRLCRFMQFLSKPSTGLNVHHYAGFFGLLFLLFHPLFLAARLISTSLEASFTFLYTTEFINLIGLIALFLMILSMYTTLFVARNFRFWKLLHQIMLVAYVGILYHTIFVYSDISNSLILKSYILGLLILGGLAFAIQKIQYYLKPKVVRDEVTC